MPLRHPAPMIGIAPPFDKNQTARTAVWFLSESPIAEYNQAVENKAQHHCKGGGAEFTEEDTQADPAGQSPHRQHTYPQHRQVDPDKQKHFPAEKTVPGLEGPAAVDAVAVEDPCAVTEYLGGDHRPVQRLSLIHI